MFVWKASERASMAFTFSLFFLFSVCVCVCVLSFALLLLFGLADGDEGREGISLLFTLTRPRFLLITTTATTAMS